MPLGDVTPQTILGILDESGSPEPSEPKGSEEPLQTEEPTQNEELPAPEEEQQPEEQQPEPPAAEPEKSAPPVPEGEYDPEVGPPTVVDHNGEKEWHYPESRGKILNSLAKEARAYKEIAESPEVAKQNLQRALDLEAMYAHFGSKDPAKIDRLVSYWQGRSPEAMQVFGERLVERARADNPAAYDAMGAIYIRDLSDHFYRQYASFSEQDRKLAETDPNSEPAKALYAARVMDWFLNRPAKSATEIKPADPIDSRLKDVERREAAQVQEQQRREAAAVESFQQSTNDECRTAAMAAIDEALKPLRDKGLDKQDQLAYRGARAELFSAMRQAFETDQLFSTRFSTRFEAALQVRSAEDRKALVEMYSGRAKRAIAPAIAKVISEASKRFVAQSQDTHKRLAESAAHKEVSPGGRSKAPAIANPKYDQAKKGKDVEGMMKALISG